MTAAPQHRQVTIEPARLAGWCERFAMRHGIPEVSLGTASVQLRCVNGSAADIATRWPQWTPPVDLPTITTAPSVAMDLDEPTQMCAETVRAWVEAQEWVASMVDHTQQPKSFVVIFMRRGGYGVAAVVNNRVVARKNGSKYVQGRTAAGGWSQQRFARRRAGQTNEVVKAAVEALRGVLSSAPIERFQGLMLGGDRPLVEQALSDLHRRHIASLPRCGWVEIPDPKAALLDQTPALAAHIEIKVQDALG